MLNFEIEKAFFFFLITVIFLNSTVMKRAVTQSFYDLSLTLCNCYH